MTALGMPLSTTATRLTPRRHIPRNARLWVGGTIVALYVAVAILAPLLAPFDPLLQDPLATLGAPSAEHWLGTDELGRDVLSRLIYATRIDLAVGVLGALLPAIVGTLLGLFAGYQGGWLDAVVMRTADVVQAFPTYILVIALVAALGQGVVSILVAFTLLSWVAYARLVRTEVLRIRGLDYIQAARAGGLSRWRIMRNHVFPNSISQTLVYLPSDVVLATIGLASLSFLGLGVPKPTPEWGAMIAAGQPYLRDLWWLATLPGIAIIGFGLGLSLLGEGIEERRA